MASVNVSLRLNDKSFIKSKTYNQFNSLVWRFPSKPGLLLLWKSNLLHSVDYNNSDKRIAISFNIKLI